MPVFDRIGRVGKFRHRPFRIFWNFEKIFIELGDTAPQSWTHFGNFGKSTASCRGNVTPTQGNAILQYPGKCSSVSRSFLLEISELNGCQDFIFGEHDVMYKLEWQIFYFFRNFDFFILFGWIFGRTPLKFRSKPKNVSTFSFPLGSRFSKSPTKKI